MKGMVQCVVVRLAVTAALLANVVAYAQDSQVAKSNDPQTQTAVADYNAGNMAAALVEFRKAAERGSRLAEFNYAMMLLNGEGTPVNVDEGKKWLRKAADANMSHAQYVYGKMYDDGQFVEKDPAEAHRWFLRAASQGHVQAELALAVAQQVLRRLSKGGPLSKLRYQRVALSDGRSRRAGLSRTECSASCMSDRACNNPAQP